MARLGCGDHPPMLMISSSSRARRSDDLPGPARVCGYPPRVLDEVDGVGMIGRGRELAELRALVVRSRVVAVHGAAGVGKTTLVLAACREAARDNEIPPVVHVPLAGTTDPRDAVERTAKAIGEPRPTPPPDRVAEALSALLSSTPRTVVWDDLDERSGPLADIIRRFASHDGQARLVIVSRRLITMPEAALRAPAFEVLPLSHEDAVRLVRALEDERGRTLADDLAEATAGNPLLLKVALAEAALPRVEANAEGALRRSVAERAKGPARKVLALLAAAAGPLDEAQVVQALGRGAREAVDELRKHLLVVREDARIALAPPVTSLAQEALGTPDATIWKTLATLAEQALAASGHDDAALVLAARAQLALGDVDRALRLLREHAIARAAAPTAAMERVLRDVASRSPAHATMSLRLLARELLRVGDYESARLTLDELPAPASRDEAERVALLRAECHIRAGEPEAAQRALDALERIVARADASVNAATAAAPKTKTDAKGKARPSVPALVAAKAASTANAVSTTKAVNADTAVSAGVVLTLAQLAILRGELAAARATLVALAPRTTDVPQLEARRAVEIAASHLYEERYELTHAWTSRARAAQKAGGVPVERVVTILDVHALLGLGEVDRAEEILARETRGRPGAAHGALEIAALVRRGELSRALEVGDAAIAALDRRADRLFRSVLARDLARACIGTGQLARADRMLGLAESAGDEPGLAALRPICDAERARLAEAEGDAARAATSIERAFARIPGSPFVAIDRDVMAGRTPAASANADAEATAMPLVARAYAALRGAELALEQGHLEAALDGAELAERYHATARLWYETARARLARAEALTRLHAVAAAEVDRTKLRERASRALDGCEEIATAQGYAPILASTGIVRAALEEASGDLVAAGRAIEGAVRHAGEGLDAPLARAAARLGVAAREPRGAGPRPHAARIARLGLLRTADVVWRVGARTYLRNRDDAAPEPVACTVDIEDRRVRVADGKEIELPEQRLALLSALAESGDGGASLEEIFARVWGGSFHPLRHRNAVYVALARLKESLRPFARDIRITHDGDRYRLAGPLPVAVRRRAPSPI
jgi:tetratricopeptide (TPR) repeat protein